MEQTRIKGAQFYATVVIILAVVFAAGFAFGERAVPPIRKVTTLEGKEAPIGVTNTADFAPFWTAWNLLNEKYVSATSTAVASDQEKVWGAIIGLTGSVKDPYTVFFPPEETKMFESEISGNFEGVGMEIGVKDDVLTVIAPLRGTPAEKAGIRPGDKILKINDDASVNMRVDEAVKRIRGKKGTEVTLTLFREGKKESFELKVTRDLIDIPTLETEVRDGKTAASGGAEDSGSEFRNDGVFIIKLYNFSANSPRLFRDALRAFVKTGSNKLLLDLRSNPGGYLEAAVDMASWFLPTGSIIVTEDAGAKGARNVHRSRGYDVFNKSLKMVILVNNGSASASEILAGALQEHGVAKLIGTQTFGKGSVQELVKITPDTSLKVTVARWLTPDGTSISLRGITPDVEVKLSSDDIEKKRDPQMEKAIELLTTDH
ncbi:MAG: S41 family peptidase [Patescibacteria group bacterium]